MKIVKFFCIMLIVILICGCSNVNIVYSDSYVYGQDSQFSFRQSDTCGMAETTDGYYFITGPEMGFLYYHDKAGKKTIPVCNKPNCSHADEPDPAKIAQCNAFLGGMPMFLRYYEGAIYYILNETAADGSDFYTLNKTSLDGTKHQRIYTFKDIPQEIQIHRGYVYYSNIIWADDNHTEYKLCGFPIDNADAKPEIIEEGKQLGGFAGSMLCYGNNVYYIVTHYTDTTMEKHVASINRFNIQTKAVSAFVSDPGVIGGFTIFNGKFVYPVPGQGTFACDLDGTNKAKIYDEYGINLAGENLLCIDNLTEARIHQADRKLTIMDQNWKVVKTVSLEGIREPPLGCTDDCYYVSDTTTKEDFDFGPINSIYCVSPDDTTPRLFFRFVPKVKEDGVETKAGD